MSDTTAAKPPIEAFDQNIEAVKRLMDFDRDAQDMVIIEIEKLHHALKEQQNISNDKLNGKRVLDFLKNIRTNDSMRARYELIFNQAVVLLVSYFGSALGDLFRLAVELGIAGADKRILSEELSVDVEELVSRGDQIRDVLGDMLIQKKDISFQDMKSVSRAFNKYFGIEIEKNKNVNNIIVGQACRHAIVHDGGRANSRVLRQIENTKPRTLKTSISENEKISFTPDEITELARNMREYVVDLHEKIMLYKNSSH